MKKIKKKLFWNMFIRSSLQSYIKLVYALLALVMILKWARLFDVLKSIVAIFMVTFLIALPPVYASVL